MHCSKSVKFYGFGSTVASLFCYIGGAGLGWAGTATGRQWRGGERDESLRELRMSERDENSERNGTEIE